MTDFPEAPASATVKVKTVAGFEWLFTVRSETVGGEEGIMKKIETLETQFAQKKWTPLAQNNGYKREEKPKKECPVHHIMMTEKEYKGVKTWSHAKGKYPDFGEWCNGKGYPSEVQTSEPDPVDF